MLTLTDVCTESVFIFMRYTSTNILKSTHFNTSSLIKQIHRLEFKSERRRIKFRILLKHSLKDYIL